MDKPAQPTAAAQGDATGLLDGEGSKAEASELRPETSDPGDPPGRLPLADGEAEIRCLAAALDRANDALIQAAGALRAADRKAAELAAVVRRQQELLRCSDMSRRKMDHRVANSLQTLIALMRIEADQQHAPVADLLHRSCSRLEALAAIHAMLHAQQRTDAVDLAACVRAVCAFLGRGRDGHGQGRTLLVELDPLDLEPEAVQSLALAVNELVANAFRHAFAPGAPGTVRVLGRRMARGGYRLSVADDGNGLPDGFAFEDRKGLGHRLVSMMAGRLGAAVDVSGNGGTCVALELPQVAQQEPGYGTLR